MSHSRARKKQKIGRNDPCPCGSGKKYKRCHGAATSVQGTPPGLALKAQELFARHQAHEKQREKQQGLGKPIISSELGETRFVAVGNRLHYSTKWKTFHDFLIHYIPAIFGKDWGNIELRKLLDERHPVCVWYYHLCHYQKTHETDREVIHTAPMTGAAAAYLGLAYNLYLLAHNVRLQEVLIGRLKNPALFLGACYETYVAAAFIKAGFLIELEDESDPRQSHCEFVATHKQTGRRFSVEAKARAPGKANVMVGNQLHAALSKNALHPRVIFIDVNVPTETPEVAKAPWLWDVLGDIRRKEAIMTVRGQPAPPAYVILTNYPHQYGLEKLVSSPVVVAEGFKIPDFKMDCTFYGIREARLARERHIEIFQLMKAMATYWEFPSTFDGEIPEFAYDSPTTPRLLIGNSYFVPTEDGTEVPGRLIDATVAETERKVYGIYALPDGRHIISTCPLNDQELAAYKRHPDTFFGIYKPTVKNLNDALDFFDWLFEAYQHTPKEKLLTFLQNHPDIDALKGKEQKELAIIYCERMAESMTRQGILRPPPHLIEKGPPIP